MKALKYNFIINNNTSSKHRLNKNTVTGIWYISDFGDTHPHLIIRSPYATGTLERLLIDHDIWECVLNENQYDYNTDLMNENEYIGGLTKMLRTLIKSGSVYTVYNADKEGNAV